MLPFKSLCKSDIPVNSVKAALAILFFLCVMFCCLMFWGLQVFHLPGIYPFLVFWSPFLIFLGYLVKNSGIDTPMNNIVYCRMNYYFPFHFTRDFNHVRNSRIDLNSMKQVLQDGDIVLRRYNNHLDGLIFKQNSYFTHAGICERVAQTETGPGGNPQQDAFYVWHTTAAENVHRISLEQFCNCDDVAVFRLCPQQLPKSKKFKKATGYIRKYGYRNQFTLAEQDIYAKLFEEVNSGKKMAAVNLDWELYRATVVQKARLLEGTLYDPEGNFTDPTRLCCIEYVWLCYLCLFPLHIIEFSNFRYFNVVNVLSLIPDVFIRNRYFDCKYTSVKNVSGRREFERFASKHKVSFLGFMLGMFAWQVFFLLMIFLLSVLFQGVCLSWF